MDANILHNKQPDIIPLLAISVQEQPIVPNSELKLLLQQYKKMSDSKFMYKSKITSLILS